ncbi:phosphonate C-P lyase system protein PhnH [Acuticoccus mangrovi]|uniref:Phosphonate C-P lyase system protein PhnH n=1 Tax=Acuticoccus mangrovi TaxID=2796142 RepID=A0A934IKE6_9HYPH|nr:phosphonate C-P lyase system protein PhnH [Acuticoccus mangrovi]MBJ3775412.1 phosphonate C-P lyase system protein PhnH [Acuticoccus mangrovi]
MDAAVLEGGFADAARDSQSTFRAILSALSEPGTVHPVTAVAAPPAPLGPAAGAILLTLLDQETPVWLAPAFGAPVREWTTFQTGAPVTEDRAAARFAVLDTPDLAGFDRGSDAYPDRSATLILTADGATPFALAGPGVDGRRAAALPLPAAFAETWAENRALFPRGLDLLIVGGEGVIGLPRTTELLCTSR